MENSSLAAYAAKARSLKDKQLPPGTVKLLFLLHIILSAAVIYFHEPFFDEAQSWLIARDASYYDMIFYIPRYEGHPPFWTLLLSVPAKLGASYEVAMGIILLAVSTLNTYLVMFRSRLPELLRAAVPFTFFFFYQYGVMGRPYGLMTTGFLLAAIAYKSRNEKPMRYAGAMLLMCAMGGYGIAVSGGLAIVWCIEIIREYGSVKRLLTEFTRNRRFFSLLGLMCFVMAVMAVSMPAEDTFVAVNVPRPIGQAVSHFWYMLFMVPADGLITGSGFGLKSLLRGQHFNMGEIFTMTLLGVLILLPLLAMAYRKGKLLLFALPYTLLAVFGAAVYFYDHHIGIVLAFFLFIMMVCADSPDVRPGMAENIVTTEGCITAAVCIAMGILWSIISSVGDIRCNYSAGRATAEYLTEQGLDSLNIMADYSGDAFMYSADLQFRAVEVNLYYDENIFLYLNSGDRSKGYMLHRVSKDATEEQFALWRETVPDILIGAPDLDYVYSGRVSRGDYILIRSIPYMHFWKNKGVWENQYIYMRKDLFAVYTDIMPEEEMYVELVEKIRSEPANAVS